ncbi:hypothetical protein Tc00.1047053511511.5 [Trypanosoma cruzi]|uniref:Uncharacterized protein n=1 Tax=Trypanosoma cruzi (strain CL Brener) TaxID=353153 RepID=Q4DT83_TRYCC|nr:hypothetical protein Tc00.1047053511511.5 [Trypanosoma cruzi]EAN95736.1 hypothetical protein Tc00.1047053511511.5 [Trypanosoma cruzi]|eukprot:XP_817587.1 hypothetical protein [Trypanosoma cruzi strain CL Brener]
MFVFLCSVPHIFSFDLLPSNVGLVYARCHPLIFGSLFLSAHPFFLSLVFSFFVCVCFVFFFCFFHICFFLFSLFSPFGCISNVDCAFRALIFLWVTLCVCVCVCYRYFWAHCSNVRPLVRRRPAGGRSWTAAWAHASTLCTRPFRHLMSSRTCRAKLGMHATIGTDIACGNGALVGEGGGEGKKKKKGMGESSFNFLYYFYPFLCVVCVFVFSSSLFFSFFFSRCELMCIQVRLLSRQERQRRRDLRI